MAITTTEGAAVPSPAPGPALPAVRQSGSRWRLASSTVLGLGVAVWALKVGLAPLSDNSFLTHVATGRLVLDEGIPRVDPYTFTAPGTPWVVQSWLAAALYATLDRIGQDGALLALNAALVVGLGLAVVRLTRGLDSLLPRVAIVGLAVGVGAGSWTERPLLFGLLFLALILLVAGGPDAGPRPDPRWLAPAFAVWVNVHGSFPLGLVLLVCLAAGACLDGVPPARALRALRWAAIGALVGALGPLGPRLLLFPVELLSHREVLSTVAEWQAPDFTTTWQRLWLLQLLLAVVLLVRRPSWRVALPLLVFGGASLLALRNVQVASLVLVPGMAAGALGLGTIDGRRRSAAATLLAAALVVLAAAAVVGAVHRPAYDLTEYPVAPVASLRSAPGGASLRVVTPDWVGNWLEWAYGTEAGVFYDDRFDMHPARLNEDYRVLAGGRPTWSAVLDRWAIDAVVWPEEEPLSSLLELAPDWRVLERDGGWVTAVRRGGPADG